MSGLFYNTLMCSDTQCTRLVFVAEAAGFLGIPLLIATWCCCNWRKWQEIEEKREARKERLISKTKPKIDPVDRHPQYGSFQPLELEEGPEQRRGGFGSQSAADSIMQLHRSGELGGTNIRNTPDF
mmetsp:Transcript_16502/g.32580  ORF Transcript_16502/g.32580 Transcript_16502/m.32580 type:complete len:126 (-) Transcript_16502:98-475(-)|eukprot:CAMPEP_0173397110 /NCGR_PEP_ID=MMETSP1356-20130122/37424_1 /TAXON_ID=77927 ORGANISM="Hemiselmis virescens, Strain PCC157" /NCGR_SAMPLE_ID=MMETSP1356 /ASSEMBLY_ACC=CAM_ASM_000847 /LENGTH=125 /DNA_ID=CAMNT_0014356287 /DNA_START=56 /DNA_END=433 /DNA_ORIENTATION=-